MADRTPAPVPPAAPADPIAAALEAAREVAGVDWHGRGVYGTSGMYSAVVAAASVAYELGVAAERDRWHRLGYDDSGAWGAAHKAALGQLPDRTEGTDHAG